MLLIVSQNRRTALRAGPTIAATKFLVAGPQYPKTIKWPSNVRRITHLNPRWHARFYSSSRLTLNVTRRDMVRAGFSPSVRLFEAAACAATIASEQSGPDWKRSLRREKRYYCPLFARRLWRASCERLAREELQQIGLRAQQRVLAEHTSAKRAEEFERTPVNEARNINVRSSPALSEIPGLGTRQIMPTRARPSAF